MFDGLVAFAVDRWRHDCGVRRMRLRSQPGSPMKEGGLVLGTFRSERMRVLYRSRRNDHLRVMLVLVHIGITSPQVQCSGAGGHHPFLHGRRVGKPCKQPVEIYPKKSCLMLR
ncbi:hypothetical protein TNCV_2787891 [Trichonephila clavipes]|uniref:Uncharacterized protein n=1 Tax=Trichonephila clavipes TaxID=2585209 RepID=A0A8X6SMY3_TRICX|nr:hypothetical protein TNCV_2787891 [Trichonephila clavipes]